MVAQIEAGVPEGVLVDYKRDTYGRADAGVKEFLKDVSSFANTAGGHLIIGMEETERVPSAISALRIDAHDAQGPQRRTTQNFNTPRGTIKVSTPEATAVDLVGYHHHVGGLDQVATILSELAEQIEPEKLLAAAQTAPLPWAQRLGYLFDRVGAAAKTAPLKAHVGKMARQTGSPYRTTRRHLGVSFARSRYLRRGGLSSCRSRKWPKSVRANRPSK